MSLETFVMDNFSGGVSLISSPEGPGPNEFHSDSSGVEISANGRSIIVERPVLQMAYTGSTLPTAATANVVRTITNLKSFRLDQNSPDKLILSNNEGLVGTLDPNATPAVYTEIIAAAPAAEYDFVQSQDSAGTQYVWITNGASTMKKYNISTSTLSNWGGAPPNGTCLKVWKNMMVIGGVAAQPQRLYYSKIADPETWPANNFIDIKSTDDESDSIIALEVVGENLLVFKQSSLWVVFDPVGFENRRVEGVGCVHRGCVVKYREQVYWVAIDGLYSTDGTDVELESKWVASIFTDFFFYKKYGRLSITEDDLLLITNVEGWINGSAWGMRLDLKRADGQHPWCNVSAGPLSCCGKLAVGRFTGGNPLLQPREQCMAIMRAPGMFGSAQNPIIIQPPYTPADHFYNGATALRGGFFFTTWTDLVDTEIYERIRRVNLSVSVLSGSADLDFNIYKNYGGTIGFTQTVSVPGVSQQLLRVRPDSRARSHKVGLTLRGQLVVDVVDFRYRGGKEH